MKAQFVLQGDGQSGNETGPAVVSVEGEIDSTNADEFERSVRQYAPAGRLVLDLSPLEYCDSAGFAALDRLVASGSSVIVIGHDRPIRKSAELLSLPFFGRLEDARRTIG